MEGAGYSGKIVLTEVLRDCPRGTSSKCTIKSMAAQKSNDFLWVTHECRERSTQFLHQINYTNSRKVR